MNLRDLRNIKCGCSSVVERQLPKLNAVGSSPITRSKIKYGLLGTLFFCLFISGCAPSDYIIKKTPTNLKGFYHRVKQDETLWKISKIYNIELEKILSANGLSDKTIIEPGQMIFIPRLDMANGPTKETEPIMPKDDFIWPVRGKVILFYGMRNMGIANKGIDIQVMEGDSVLASRAGRVIFTTTHNRNFKDTYNNKLLFRLFKYFGHIVIINHEDGFLTLYSNNSEILVKEGDVVKQGDLIAKLNSSKNESKGCLHFEIRKGDKPQNPFYFLP